VRVWGWVGGAVGLPAGKEEISRLTMYGECKCGAVKLPAGKEESSNCLPMMRMWVEGEGETWMLTCLQARLT